MIDGTPPPCLSPGQAINPCAKARYAWEVLGHGHLPADWLGWRLAGGELISPDGDRISPERLRGILFAETSRKRVARAEPRTATVIPFRRLQDREAGTVCITAHPG